MFDTDTVLCTTVCLGFGVVLGVVVACGELACTEFVECVETVVASIVVDVATAGVVDAVGEVDEAMAILDAVLPA